MKLRRVHACVAALGVAGLFGLAVPGPFGDCPGQQAANAVTKSPEDATATTRATLYFAPTVQWLPEPQIDIPESGADTEAAMRAYTERIPGSKVTFDMLPIRGGAFLMGSPENETDRRPDEGPRHEVRVEPFWMGKCEVTWNEFDVCVFGLDKRINRIAHKKTPRDILVDAIAAPSWMEYTDPTFGMSRDGYPAVCMTQLGAKLYCRWLSAKTGRFYRLPTEAEWEYACRAGTDTAYSFGNDSEKLDEYAWHFGNADERHHRVGKKKPNPWGLHDMHGNAAEWVLDYYEPDFYSRSAGGVQAVSPFAVPKATYPRVVRGGSWDDDPHELRSAARRGSSAKWSEGDPQEPNSAVWHTDSYFVGFRVVRPLRLPSVEACDRLEGIKRDYLLRGDYDRTRKLFRQWSEILRDKRPNGVR